MPLQKMTNHERLAVFSLSTIMALRLLGLFMVLPLLTLYTSHLSGATPLLIGLSMGIYGLTQALFQVPFGVLSDHIGRKKIIALGLVLFILGSVIAAFAHTIGAMLLGRALQGMGAIGSTILAYIADLTRPEQRTKAMAISGMTIGLSFSLAVLVGPLLSAWASLNLIFLLAAALSVLAIFILFTGVPKSSLILTKSSTHFADVWSLLKNPALLRLNLGIFFLHLIFTASFVVIPIALKTFAGLTADHQWKVYLPAVFLGFLFALPLIIFAEKKHRVAAIFRLGIALLALSELLFWFFARSLLFSALSVLLFFTAFSLLEAFLPSLVSKTAPPTRKGAALGIYSFSQFFGIFVGGTLGGGLYGQFGLTQVYLACAILAILWLMMAFNVDRFLKFDAEAIYNGKGQC